MRIKKGYVLQKMADEHIAVPVGDETGRLHGVIRLNETGAFLWDLLSKNDYTEEDLVNAITEEYLLDPDTARRDVAVFISNIEELGCIERN